MLKLDKSIDYRSMINRIIHDIMNKITNLMFTIELEEWHNCEIYTQEIIRIVNLYKCLNNYEIDWSLLRLYLTKNSYESNKFEIFLIGCIIHLSCSKYKIFVEKNESIIEIIEENSMIFNPFVNQAELTGLLKSILNKQNKTVEFKSNCIYII